VKVLRESARDEANMERVVLQQLHNGVPVTAGEVIVHLRGNRVLAVNSEVLLSPDTPTAPVVDAGQAIDRARELIVRTRPAHAQGARYTTPRLEVFNRGVLEEGTYPTRLAWFVEVRAAAVREYVWIDAQTGGILLHFDQNARTLNRRVHSADYTNARPGRLVRSEGSPATGDAEVDLAYDNSGDVYNYFLREHGRDSYDGAGAALVSTVRFCPDAARCPWVQAAWDGASMLYGEGFAAADDVAAHEITHAVTEYSANLFYYMQSGALNESFSDIFGETIDLLNNRGDDRPAVRWMLGEDLPAYVGVIRNMARPWEHGDPARVGDANWHLDFSTDGGGVHVNSGVPNFAYALMVDGGSFNGRTVAGIGLQSAARIHYRALTHYLTSGANFIDHYFAVQQACQDLVGSGTITGGTCNNVRLALEAAEMDRPVPLNRPVPALCPAGQGVTPLFADNFESISNPRWTPRTLRGTGHWVVPETGWAKSGTRMAWGEGFSSVTDASLEMTSDLIIPANARLQFNHAYAFEQGLDVFGRPTAYDGSVVEYSLDGGTTWSDAGGLIVDGDQYDPNVPLTTTSGNPLGGRRAFAGNSFGYTASQLNLGSLAGRTARFRFRVGTDEAVGDIGWVIDDVQFYSCQVRPRPAMSLDAPLSGASLGSTFTVSGWAIDRGATSGTGVDLVHVWAFPANGRTPQFLGQANYGLPRPDVGALFGSLFTGSGFNMTVSGVLATGTYQITAFAHSTATNTFNASASATISIVGPQSNPAMALDTPLSNVTVGRNVTVAGWAIDRGASSGTGVDTVHVWAFPAAGGAAKFLGAATYGLSRPDVGSAFGSRFSSSGFRLTVAVDPGTYTIVAFAHSTVAALFNASRAASNVRIQAPNTNPLLFIDTPGQNTTQARPFTIMGWAIDLGTAAGTGIDTIHIWAFPVNGLPAIFVGAAQYGMSRPDIGAAFRDARFNNSGFSLTVSGANLVPGTYDVVVFGRSTVTAAFTVSRVVRVSVQ
jgi:bacillolysin